MNENIELLEFMHKNATMGVHTVDELVKQLNDKENNSTTYELKQNIKLNNYEKTIFITDRSIYLCIGNCSA